MRLILFSAPSIPSRSPPTQNKPKPNYYKPKPSTAASTGTFAALPSRPAPTVAPSIPLETEVGFDMPEVVATSADGVYFMELRKQATTIKVLTGLDFVRVCANLLSHVKCRFLHCTVWHLGICIWQLVLCLHQLDFGELINSEVDISHW